MTGRTAAFAVWVTLLGLLALTVAVSRLPLGALGAVIALAIAATKAALIATFFMHLRESSPLVRLVAGIGLLWLGILFALTFSDYLTRGG